MTVPIMLRAKLSISLCLFLAAFGLLSVGNARAAQITGISDENLAGWSARTWNAFNATGIKQVRKIVPWDTALNAGKLAEASKWIKRAEARDLEILISFRHNEGQYPLPQAYADAVVAFRQHFPQITKYTAWNEPNHKPGGHATWSPAEDPARAAGYWITMNHVCTAPQYGPPCTVAAGDFLDNNNGVPGFEKFKNYVDGYRQTLVNNGQTTSVWAVHPYAAARDFDGKEGHHILSQAFMNRIENKPVWFTEVGGMVCKPGEGAGAGPSAEWPLTSQEVQNRTAKRLLSLIDHYGSRIQRTYYYSFSGTQPESCSGPNYIWDSNLTDYGQPRSAYHTLFPSPGISLGRTTLDFSGDSKADLITRKPDGTLMMYRGNGAGGWITGFGQQVGSGMQQYDQLFTVSDFSGDGFMDLLGRRPDGSLWMYRGDGSGSWVTGYPEWLGSGWDVFDLILSPGDFTGDGKTDLIARKPEGTLWLYRGNGAGGWITGSGEGIGHGWQVFDSIVSPGDFSGDGTADLIARKPDGTLWLYRGDGAGWWKGEGENIGSGMGVYDKILSVSDFTGDAKGDLFARMPDGTLWLYRGNGAGSWITGFRESAGFGLQVYDVLQGAY